MAAWYDDLKNMSCAALLTKGARMRSKRENKLSKRTMHYWGTKIFRNKHGRKGVKYNRMGPR